MTIEEKRDRIRLFCCEWFNTHDTCIGCPINPIVKETGENCYSEGSGSVKGANIERNYALLFGGKNKEPDNVNHPQHYETGEFECIDVMVEAIGLEDTKGFCLCNAFKYIYRCTKKHNTPVEDVKKAIWYLNKFLELEG